MNNFKDIIKFTKNMNLLFVEDDEFLRESLIEVFNSLFKDVTSAINGEDGIEKFYENKIDMVVSGVNMPKLNGLDMIERIRDFDKDIPILILSANSETDYFIKSIELNIDGYLLKPMQLEKLKESLSKIIQKMKFQKEFNDNLNFLQQYQELTDSNTAVSKADTQGVITYVNNEFCKLTGYDRDELIGHHHNILRHPDNPASMYSELWHVIKNNKKPWKGIIKNLTKDSNTYYIKTVIQPILDTDNNIVEYISIKTDITNIMSSKKILYDFIDSANNPILVLIKIEGFMDIEKFYGYIISQRIEEKFAKDLENLMPKNLNFNKFFSLENGEFAFVQDLEDNSSTILENITQALQSFQYIINELKIDAGEIDYDISIMMSVANGKDCIENVKYGMKTLEKNKQDFILANDLAQKEQDEAANNLKILKMVKQAIETSNIISYFQPIVSNKTKEVVKYESLVRLVDENSKVISPFFFLNIAKKGKYYAQITAIVLENSFEALKITDKSISINISALDIEKPITRKKIYELLDIHKESAHRVVFELLEDEDVKDFDEITKFISEVKKYGVKIAIDDFGAGYSNFERLLKYQPDILKIDGSLIKNIEQDSYSLSVVKTIVSFAKEQNIEIIAEFIENENIYNILKDLGVEYSQGYYFGKPFLMK
ncbi:MAG: EAL domain-containing protein [Sulfurimonas sp.]|nr:EAL domain-containing protein [Sulfurimonas sp.]